MAAHHDAWPGAHDANMRVGSYLTTASGTSHDPRSSSMQSLVPERAEGRRKLLLIYIHGFMGNETSFQSFPAHVHNLVSILVAETHVVHTKVYPRYKSRRALDQVAEDFSKWLQPHESQDTDTVLLGHSMGGLLSAEVTLLNPTASANKAFRHRMLGTINFDVPFLGMHPGVISSGLASVFRPSPSPPGSPNLQPQDAASESATSLSTTASSIPARHNTMLNMPADPNYNPKFTNDINLPVRKGWRSTMHFINKHSDGLRHATKQYVKSHMEFGGAMADLRGLHTRYNRLRSLEDTNDSVRQKGSQKSSSLQVPRVRFINYYTACDGIQRIDRSGSSGIGTTQQSSQNLVASSRSSLSLSRSPSPRISLEGVRDDGNIVTIEEDVVSTELDHEQITSPLEDDVDLEPLTSQPSLDYDIGTEGVASSIEDADIKLPVWPPLSPPPMEPTPPDLSRHDDKLVQRALKREHERKLKAYKQTIKDREAALADRKVVEDKIRRHAARELVKNKSHKGKANKAGDTPSVVLSRTPTNTDVGSTLSPSTSLQTFGESERSIDTSKDNGKKKEPRERHFCVLPSKRADGTRDETWVRVFMHGVDEVGAHCGLFQMNETYERLVGDVGNTIEKWVQAC